MVYKISHIARDVRIAIDENKTSERLLASNDIETLSLDDIIYSKIEDAVRQVESIAPLHLLEEGHNFGEAAFWSTGGRGWVLLPDDFMRLILFRMSDWERTVYTAISADDPQYAKQASRYKGIRGNPQKPVCAIVNQAEGRALEFYSCKDENAYVMSATYIPYPRIDDHGGIDICQRCYRAVVYTAAALVMTTLGELNMASVLTETAKSFLQ